MILALFFGRASGDRGAVARVVAEQYLGFAAILAVSIVGTLGVGLLPDTVIPYLGLLPLLLGLRAAWRVRRERHAAAEDETPDAGGGPTVLTVADSRGQNYPAKQDARR